MLVLPPPSACPMRTTATLLLVLRCREGRGPSARGDFRLELFLGQTDHPRDAHEHVVDRAVPLPFPVPRVNDVLVRDRLVVPVHHVHDRACR